MTNEERNIAIADMRRMKAEYMNGREMDEIAERKCKSFDIAIKAIKQTTWIPCSERLPEKNVEVLATTEWGEVTIAEIFGNGDWFIHEGATNAETDEIAAWMPLPEPYKCNNSEKYLNYANQDTLMPAT